MHILYKLLPYTGLAAEKAPDIYSMFHLLAFIISVVVATACAFALKNKNTSAQKVVFLCCGSLMLSLESYRILFISSVNQGGITFKPSDIVALLCVLLPFAEPYLKGFILRKLIAALSCFISAFSFIYPLFMFTPYLAVTVNNIASAAACLFLVLYVAFSLQNSKTLDRTQAKML